MTIEISAHSSARDGQRGDIGVYRHALATGADYVEFDIRRTEDGELVSFHDPATADGTPLARMSYRDLCRLAGYEVPRVPDLMRLIQGRAKGHLDLKETGYEDDLVRMALDILGAGQFVVTTLEDASVAAVKSRFGKQVPAALSLGRDLTGAPRATWARIRVSEFLPMHRILACGADWAALNRQLARAGVLRECHRRGISVMVWTVNDERDIRHWLRNARLSVLVTDRPARAVALRNGTPAA